MTLKNAAVAAMLALCSLGIAALATAAIRREGAALVERFAGERADQVAEVAADLEEDFEDIADDLRFAAELVHAADSAPDRERELRALLAVVRHYRAVAVFDEHGREVLGLFDAQRPTVDTPAYRAAMADVAARAARAEPGTLVPSRVVDGDADGWLRIFAAPVATSVGGNGAIAIVVDTSAFFSRLRVLSSPADTLLLVLGPYGAPAPATSGEIEGWLDDPARGASPAFQDLLARMRRGDQGTLLLPASQAPSRAAHDADAAVAYAPLPVRGGAHWAIATITSTASLRDHERALVVRFGAAAAGATALAAAFAAWLVVLARRQMTVRQQLAEAEREAELQRRLLRAEKLATVGVLAAGIAHEIGTPLGVVRGRAEYVLGKLGSEHAQASGIKVIVEQIDRVTRTMRQLLDFSRARPAAVRPVPLAPAVRGVVELLRIEAERRGVALRDDVPEDAPALAADPDQLQQVLLNLAMNACDACARGGRVVVRGAQGPDTSFVHIEVTDDGCGIPADLHHQVFDPFFTTKKRGQGTGLGLTVAAQIVRDHGGTVALESAPGRGTTIQVAWPAATPGEEPE